MRVIHARNVNDAWPQATRLLQVEGEQCPSRAGDVLVLPEPVTTTYQYPRERVLFCPIRDANPMFHLMESLWMLAGRRDARWLDLFVSDFSERFGEREGLMWGAYGHRWRHWFLHDQLSIIVHRLVEDPDDRRCVLGMWDPGRDLMDAHSDRFKDYPCNTTAFIRTRRLPIPPGQGAKSDKLPRELDLTICCRSNDIVWGAYGANAVHFSVLQEYLAARIGCLVGRLYQVSNNWHAYLDTFPREQPRLLRADQDNPYEDGSMYPQDIVSSPTSFDEEVYRFVDQPGTGPWRNHFLGETAWPMYECGRLWREATSTDDVRRKDATIQHALAMAREVRSPDWRRAAIEWFERRVRRRRRGQGTGEDKPAEGRGGGEISHVADAPPGDGG